MQLSQQEDGSFLPLWFGDQQAQEGQSPVYGTAMVVEYLSSFGEPLAHEIVQRGLKFLLSTQNRDGGWGGDKDIPSKVTFTARALSALASYPEVKTEVTDHAFDFLYRMYESGHLFQAEPIGLYFARLWYSEKMYPVTFLLNALKKYQTNNELNKIKQIES